MLARGTDIVYGAGQGWCMRRRLSTGENTAASLSIVTFIPCKPLYAATVTAKTALLSETAQAPGA